MSATLINRPDPGTKGFLGAMLSAIIFMIISAAVLVSGFLAWHYPQISAGSDMSPITLSGNDLYIALGKGKQQDSKLIVNQLTKEGAAVISSKRARFNASDFPFLNYKITGRNPGTDAVLYWRTITHNHQTLFAKLHWNSDYKTGYNLQNHPEWKGQITELGISIAGDLRNDAISIEHLTFTPTTVESLLLTAWSEWNAYAGWAQSSINVIKGMPPGALVSPVVAAAGWCGLAILMYSLRTIRRSVNRRDALLSIDRVHPDNSTWNITKRNWDLRAVVSMFMIAWLSLDGKWQINLWRQLADTKYLFAGKTHYEQHMATNDAKLYEYAKRLKEKVLPEEPVRLFILRNEKRDRTRLKLMYYLLPNNIYNFGKYPNPEILRDGDYVLSVNPIKGLSYSNEDAMLHYEADQSMQADLLDESPVGSLFKVKSNSIFLGTLNIDSRLKKDALAGRLMEDPVLITGVPTYNGRDPGVPALSKNKNNRLHLHFQEWDYRDNKHTTEQVSVLALERGTHHMQDRSLWEVGAITLVGSSTPRSVQFETSFSEPPKLFLMPQNSFDQNAISVRATSVTRSGFEFIINPQESKKKQPTPTTVGYLAIHSPSDRGTVIIENKETSYRLTQTSISSNWVNIDDYELFLQEEKSLDQETKHTSELVDILEIDGSIFGQVVSNHEPDTVSLRMRGHASKQ